MRFTHDSYDSNTTRGPNGLCTQFRQETSPVLLRNCGYDVCESRLLRQLVFAGILRDQLVQVHVGACLILNGFHELDGNVTAAARELLLLRKHLRSIRALNNKISPQPKVCLPAYFTLAIAAGAGSFQGLCPDLDTPTISFLNPFISRLYIHSYNMLTQFSTP